MNLLDWIQKENQMRPDVLRTFWTALLLLAVSFFLPSAAFAQSGTGVITGTVVDATNGQPVGDVVVTATSSALQGEQIMVTDTTGQFRLPNLPPGDYTLRMDKETYKPFSRGGITLRTSTTIRVNAQLAPESFKEEIVVVGRAPTVDVGSSSTGQNINQEFTRRIAVAPPASKGGAVRSFESVAEVAPGAKTDTYGTSINGTTSPENSYMIDGLSVNDPAYGVVGTPLTIEFIKEVNVVSGGYMPEYGRTTGGVLEVVTKTGSNEFHGSVFFNITPGIFEGRREQVVREGSTVRLDTSLSSIRDFGFEIGGPILKDKLWFYAGVDLAFTTRNVDRYINRITGFDPVTGLGDVDPETGFTTVQEVPGTRRVYKANEESIQYIGKLTFQINQDNSLTLGVFGSPSFSGGDGRFGIDPQDGDIENGGRAGSGAYTANAHRYLHNSNDITLKWSTAFNNKKLLFDTTLGWHHQREARLPSDGSDIASGQGLSQTPSASFRRTPNAARTRNRHSITDFETIPGPECDPITYDWDDDEDPSTPPVQREFIPCPVVTYLMGGPDFLQDSSLDRYQLKTVFTSLFEGLGHHVIKAGLDGEITSYANIKAYSGETRYRESTAGTRFDDNRQYGFLYGPEVGDYIIQKKVDLQSNSVIVGGFVQDSWNVVDKITVNLGVRYDTQFLIGNDGTIGLALPNQWSPRVGVVYDFTQQGRSKLFANYARYYESVPLDIADRSLGAERSISSSRPGPGDPQVVGDMLCDPRVLEEALGDDCRGTAPGQKLDIGGRLVVPNPHDPNRYWLPTGGAKTPVDPDLSPQSSDEIVVGGEYEVIENGRVGISYTKRWMNNVIEDMSRDEANTYFIGNPGKGIASDFPEASRDYDAVTLYFQKSFADLWLAQASYTISYLRGNYAGLFRPETEQLDPNINSDFDLKSLTINRFGPLDGDRTHEIKIFGAKAFEIPGGMVADLGLTFTTRSGRPTSYLGSHSIYGADEIFILPRGAGERTPWVHRIDGHVGYAFDLAKDSQLMLTMDIFNIFNFQAITSIDDRYTNADVNPCVDGTIDDLETSDPTQSCLTYSDTGATFDPTDKNPNFGNPTRFQEPRTFRFGARVTF